MIGIKISGLAFITWCPQKDISGIWETQSIEKHCAAHAGQTLNRLSQQCGNKVAWLSPGSACKAMGAVGMRSRAPITEGEVVVTAQHWTGAVPLRAPGTRPGEKRQRKRQGQILTLL